MIEIVIDPGHGGSRPSGNSTPYGARGPSGTLEKDVNLALARRVSAHLDGVGVALTREEDRNPSLGERQALASRSRARALLSIHTRAQGENGDGAAIWVHERSDGRSRRMAEAIGEELSEAMGLGASLRAGPLALLHPDALPRHMDACMVEVGALEEAAGERCLRDPVWLDTLGAAIARGVRRHYGLPLALHPGAWGPPRRVGAPVREVHTVTLIPQPTTWGCWAASCAMVKKTEDPPGYYDAYAIAAPLGYTAQLETGLSDAEAAQVARHWGLVLAPDQNWTVEGFAALLRERGPLWVSTNPAGSVHDVCVSGIEGDGTPEGTSVFIHNPWPIGSGRSQTLTYREFIQIYEPRATGRNLIIHARRAPHSMGRRLGGTLRPGPAAAGVVLGTVSDRPSNGGYTGFAARFGTDEGSISLGSARRVIVWFEVADPGADLSVVCSIFDPSASPSAGSLIAQAAYDVRGAEAVGVDFRQLPANGPITSSMDGVKWTVEVIDNSGRNQRSLSGTVFGL